MSGINTALFIWTTYSRLSLELTLITREQSFVFTQNKVFSLLARLGQQHQVHPDELSLFPIVIFACQRRSTTSSQPEDRPLHPVITIPWAITTYELGGVPVLLFPKPFVPMGLGANLASPPKWARAATLSPPAEQRRFWQ